MEIILVVTSIAVISSFYWLRFFVRIRSSQLDGYETWSQTFYAKVQPLIDDKETPKEVLDVIDFVNARLSDKLSARRALFALLRGRGENVSNEAKAASNVVKAFRFERPELASSFHHACAAGLLAISFKSFFFGSLLRRMVLFDVKRDDDRAERLSTELSYFSPEMNAAA